jgi:hypothetical protein
MDALTDTTPAPFAGSGPLAERRVRAFRAMDAFALETYQALRGNAGAEADGLFREIRGCVARVGGELIGACSTTAGSDTERLGLLSARRALFEARYQLYLARRLGFIDLRRYRAATLRQEALLKEVLGLLSGAGGRHPP